MVHGQSVLHAFGYPNPHNHLNITASEHFEDSDNFLVLG